MSEADTSVWFHLIFFCFFYKPNQIIKTIVPFHAMETVAVCTVLGVVTILQICGLVYTSVFVFLEG